MIKSALFKQLYQNMVKRDEYLDSVPSDISAAIFDNGYVNRLQEDHSIMLKAIFQEHTEAVEWFLYEWKPGYTADNTIINNIDQYIEYMKQNDGFE